MSVDDNYALLAAFGAGLGMYVSIYLSIYAGFPIPKCVWMGGNMDGPSTVYI